MKNLQTSSPLAATVAASSSKLTRLTAVLAVAAGLLTGAMWPAGPLDRLVADHAADAVARKVDPAIPALTIVAKKLSAAEKRAMARDDALAESDGMLRVSGVAVRRAATDPAF